MANFKQKTLGKLESKLLLVLQRKGLKIFGLKDALAVTKTSYDATRLLIANLVKKGWIRRLKKGKYLILALGEDRQTLKDWYLVAAALADPKFYYISHYTALSLHNMTTQPALTIYVSTSKRIPNRTIANIKFHFIFCSAQKSWGIEEKWINKQDKIKISSPERTIIDVLSRLDLCGGLSEAAKAVWLKRKELDFEQLLKYAKNAAIIAVCRRLGYILELYGLATKKIRKELQREGKSFSILDPALPKKGRYSKKWKLLINSNPQELKKIVWT